MTLALSVVVVARNEAARLPDCLRSVADADELVVVDHRSTDETAGIARALGARVVEADGPLSELRRIGCATARAAWILCLDADERLPAGGVTVVRDAIAAAGESIGGFRLPIRTYVGDRMLRWGGYYPAARLRLLRAGQVRWPQARVHERPEVEGVVASLSLPIEHPAFRDLAHVREKQRRYAAWAALDLRAAKRRPTLPAGLARATWRALRSYVFRGGFLMGRLGWSMAWVQAQYVWQRTRWAREGPPAELLGPR